MKQILFVCHGNICRSPGAEAIFKSYISKHRLDELVSCDSAGTDAYHVGERADNRMRKAGAERGYNLTSISRRVNPKIDFAQFDYIIGMDHDNIRTLRSMAKDDKDRSKIRLMTDFCSVMQYDHVPDPYYGGTSGFELVLDILEDACEGLIKKIQKDLKGDQSQF